jgi:indole-3-glycerol phosphate synthase
MNILDEIINFKRGIEVPAAMSRTSIMALRIEAKNAPEPLDFVACLKKDDGVALIAEVKKASPSKGLLCPDFDPVRLANLYAHHGAAAISVLTDEPYFQGSLDYLRQIRQQLNHIPLMRKDFIIHAYQIYEARAVGADALLLIAAALADHELKDLMCLTHNLGMAALVEIHNQEELERALRLSPKLIGVNNRNLHDFNVDLKTSLSLRVQVPEHICFVAESGIRSKDDVAQLEQAGVDAMLIGEAIITAPDIGEKIKELTVVRDG